MGDLADSGTLLLTSEDMSSVRAAAVACAGAGDDGTRRDRDGSVNSTDPLLVRVNQTTTATRGPWIGARRRVEKCLPLRRGLLYARWTGAIYQEVPWRRSPAWAAN